MSNLAPRNNTHIQRITPDQLVTKINYGDYQFTEAEVRTILDQMMRSDPNIQPTPEEVMHFLYVARERKLNPLLGQIHCIYRKNNKAGRMIPTHQVSIDGFRAIANRSGSYAPGRATTFEYSDPPKKIGNKLIPFSATAYAVKYVQGHPHEFSTTVYWDEYAQYYNGELMGLWKTHPHVMLGKCAEAANLRRGWPEDLGQIYEASEMGVLDAEYNIEEIDKQEGAHQQTSAPAPRVEKKPEYKHLKKDGMDTDTLVRTATSYQREKADKLAEEKGYVFTKKLNEYNEIELRHVLDFLEGKREYHRVSQFIKKLDLVERIETSPAEDTQRTNLIEAHTTLVNQLNQLNADIDGSPHLLKCVSLDVDECPTEHLIKANKIMADAVAQLEAQPIEVVDVAIPALVGEWARQVRSRLVQEDVKFDQWTTGMICQFLAESVHHAKDHTELKSLVPFDPAEVTGLTPQAIYEKIIEKTKELDRCRQIILAGDRAGIQGKTARSTTVKK